MTTQQPIYKFVSLEGSIGAGKSTMLARIKQEFINRGQGDRIYIVQESVSEWEDIKEDGKGMLELFYSDKKKYAFMFQCLTLTTLFKNIKNAINKSPGCIILSERSLYSNRFIFETMMHQSGDITESEHLVYVALWKEMVSIMRASTTIYLDTDVKTCMKRINSRNRPGEEGIPLEYMENLHLNHHHLTKKVQNNIITLDGNCEITDSKYTTNICGVVDFLLEQ